MVSDQASNETELGTYVIGDQRPYSEISEFSFELPYCIYFYYLKNPKNNAADVYYIEQQTEIDDDEEFVEKIKSLVENARGAQNNPAKIASQFDAREWTRVSWIVVAYEGGQFYHDHPVDIGWDYNNNSTPPYEPNHSFFEGWCDTISVRGQDIDVICMRNHIVDQNGNRLMDKTKPEHFKFRFVEKSDRKILTWPDESGTNVGPPVPPP